MNRPTLEYQSRPPENQPAISGPYESRSADPAAVLTTVIILGCVVVAIFVALILLPFYLARG